MAMTLEELERQASALAPMERARLAEYLLDSLADASAAAVRAAWDVEIAVRVAAHERGSVEVTDAASVFTEARRLAR